jgi:copper(I)-binding protein
MKRVLTLIPAVALLVAACGSSDETVTIDNAWARASAAGQTTGAIYFDLSVSEDDTLVGASVPSSVAAEAQIHEVVMAPAGDDTTDDTMADMTDDTMADMTGDTMAGMDDTGGEMMTMQEVAGGLALVAGETVSFEPGGYHVMLLDLAKPLEVGDQIELTLEFAKADPQTLTVEVAESAP